MDSNSQNNKNDVDNDVGNVQNSFIPTSDDLPFNNAYSRPIVYYPPSQDHHTNQGDSNAKAIVSLILGIASVILSAPLSYLKIPLISVFAVILAIASLKLGCENKHNKIAKAGAILAILGLLFGTVTTTFLFIFY